jgi:hypothetical protein
LKDRHGFLLRRSGIVKNYFWLMKQREWRKTAKMAVLRNPLPVSAGQPQR